MNDLISRQAAMEAIKKAVTKECALWSIEALPTAERVGKWIPVSKKLPEPDNVYKDDPTYYLVQNEYGDMMVATFIQFPGGAEVWQQMYQDGAIMEDIVAWRPLPEPWRGEEGG